jgi:NhaA family Na+:H+ antiporter
VLRRLREAESAGSIVLLVAVVAALVWANSSWGGSYRRLWATVVPVRLGRPASTEDLRHWVNDGLMALFFFVVGLEIKGELVHGRLRDRRTAATPAIAAAGGMAVPALLYLVLTSGTRWSTGWGIPMATDIAFAVGVVAALGPRVPASLKLFLLTLAIVDDIGAVMVIAVVYAGHLRPAFLLTAVALVVVMAALRRAGVVRAAPYVALAVGVWLATLASGVHATIAGVVLGLLAPARPPSPTTTGVPRASVPHAARMEQLLAPWTTFVVVPVFALANAGIVIRAGSFRAPGALAVGAGVMVGLVLGKTAGITAATWLAVHTGLGRLPEGATWAMLVGVAAVGGIGFTVSLFVAELAFDAGPVLDAAKLGVLGGSGVAAVAGALALSRACRPAPRPGDDR